ncbi:10342_t:CDS:2 [Funneliformis mosseae]|uniref:10342_t:CDS:1 n=1 Tax=Funneliformis mosseae TaxID=27381 RepID=A0A9N8VQW4_FUNMO|nr:10342_t:CDS:2 [Funneliformis mosseae]
MTYARNYFLVYILFAACFATVGGTYVTHFEATGHYLLVVEYRSLNIMIGELFKLFNFTVLLQTVIEIVVMSVYVNIKNAIAKLRKRLLNFF